MFYPNKRESYDPVEEEMESRRPYFQRMQTRGMIFCLLAVIVWLVARLLGIDMPFPFHFW